MINVLQRVRGALHIPIRCDAWSLRLDKYGVGALRYSESCPEELEESKRKVLDKVIRDYNRSNTQHFLRDACQSRNEWLDQLKIWGKERYSELIVVNQSKLLLHLGRASVLEHVGIHSEHATGIGVIPGTAVKGLVSKWACWEEHEGLPLPGQEKLRKEMASKARLILGDDSKKGSNYAGEICFLGGFPEKPPKLTLDINTPHHDSDGHFCSPDILPFLAWSQGMTWRFPLLSHSRSGDPKKLLEQALIWLEDALSQIGIGAKTTSGYGRFRLKNKKTESSENANKSKIFSITNLRLRLLTPAFCAGANPEEEAEMRISSLRGQWRWWLRLLYPGRRFDNDILGSSNETPVRASKLSFTIQTEQIQKSQVTYPVDQKAEEKYLIWPLGLENKQRYSLDGVKLNKDHFSISYTELAKLSEEEANAWKNALIAWSLLGGFGLRSNRGYGAVWPDTDFALWTPGKFSIPNEDTIKSSLSFLPDSIKVRLLNRIQCRTPLEALCMAADWWIKLRAGSSKAKGGKASSWGENDHNVAYSKTASPKDCVYRPALGLPLEQKFKNDHCVKTTLWVNTIIGDSDRWPSPIHFRPIAIGENFSIAVIIFSNLIPDPVKNQVKLNGKKVTLSLGLIDHILEQGNKIH